MNAPNILTVGKMPKAINSLPNRWKANLTYNFATFEQVKLHGTKTVATGDYQILLIGISLNAKERAVLLKNISKRADFKDMLVGIVSNDSVYDGVQILPTDEPTQIAEKLNLQPLVSPADLIIVTAGKGGVGKSHIAINLAVTLAKMGARVALIDDDLRTRSVRGRMGISEGAPSTAKLAAEIETNGGEVTSDIVSAYLTESYGVHVLPAPTSPFAKMSLSPPNGRDVLAILGTQLNFDFIVIDSPPDAINTSCFTYGVLSLKSGSFTSPQFLIPVVPEKDMLGSTNDTIDTLEHFGIPVNFAKPIINCVQLSHEPDYLNGTLWTDPVGILPHCPAAQFVGESQKPLVSEEVEGWLKRVIRGLLLGRNGIYQYQKEFERVGQYFIDQKAQKGI